MKKKKNLKRAAAFLAGSVILLTGTGAAFPVPVSAAGDCVIDTGKPIRISADSAESTIRNGQVI